MPEPLSIRVALLKELEGEESSTLRTLERVPQDRWDWAPHANSSAMGRLAVHVATLPQVALAILTTSELDVAARRQAEEGAPQSARDLAPTAQGLFHKVREQLQAESDASLDQNWTFRFGDRQLFHGPKALALRQLFMNHLVHHRAQLGVYLRLCGIPVPSVYGPSADENLLA